MKTTSGEPEDTRALAAFTELTRDGIERRTTEELDQGLNVLLARVAAGRSSPRRGIVRWSLMGGVVAVCALVGLQVSTGSRKHSQVLEPSVLAYQIEGGSVIEGGYLRESGHAGIKLLFNEGSQFVFLPGTRGRLRSVAPKGARVAIEHGKASFQVTPSTDRRWLVEAGPFLITVKGTVFTVAWDPSSERFELSLRHGRVEVSGPVSGGDIVLRAGQQLVVNLAKAETLIMEEKPEETVVESVGAATSRAIIPSALRAPLMRDKPALPSPSGAPVPATVAKLEGEHRWTDELASGHWDHILEEVERTGIKAALDKASSEDLFALADAARYRRRMDLAREALLAERRRFPGSPRALDALFLLGRVAESGERGATRAIAWYDDYLSRAPAGAYAAEALGRKMTLTSESGGSEEARPLAEEYLRRFPKGSYAGSARALQRAP